MGGSRGWGDWFSGLAAFEKAAIAFTAVMACFLVVDPLVFMAVQSIDIESKQRVRLLTEIGRSRHTLLPCGLGIALLLFLRARERRLRRRAAYGLGLRILGFYFAVISVSGLTAALIKNTIGRARPKFFEELGPLEFQPFTYDSDFASFPSGHSATAGAIAGVLAIVWPRARIPLLIAGGWVAASRFLVGAHYFSDAVAGCAFGVAFAYAARDRMAFRGWMFRKHAGGEVRMRGRALLTRFECAIAAWLKSLVTRRVSPEGGPRQ